MSDQTASPPAFGASLRASVERVSQPLLWFAGALCILLGFSWLFLLPEVTSVEVSGQRQSSRELVALHAGLQAQLAQVELRRDELLLPVTDPLFLGLRAMKLRAPSLVDLRSMIVQRAKEDGGPDGTIALEEIQMDASADTLTVAGDVRGVGPRSMTVLAQFVENLRHLPFVSSLTPPVFVRMEDEKIGQHSPFTMTITLSSSQ